jgi:hypothetical protein
MWALATLRVSPDTALVQSMSSETVSKAKEFKPQNISNSMWALATLRVSPDPALVHAMLSEAVSKAKEFNPQNIANLMWALAKLGLSLDPALVQSMSSEAVSKTKEFKPQNIANLLWALATLRVTPDPALVRAMLDNFTFCDLGAENKMQLHTFLLFNSLSRNPMDLSTHGDLVEDCKTAFNARSPAFACTSALQKDVASVLRTVVTGKVLEEEVLEDSGYSVDIRIAGTRITVEVDGPSHYLRGIGQERMMDGSTQSKARMLRQLGWTVLQVLSTLKLFSSLTHHPVVHGGR